MRIDKLVVTLATAALLSAPAIAQANADSLRAGSTQAAVSLDPAAAWDHGSQQLIGNLYQNLLTIPAGGNQPRPDAAQRCAYKHARTYVCTECSRRGACWRTRR